MTDATDPANEHDALRKLVPEMTDGFTKSLDDLLLKLLPISIWPVAKHLGGTDYEDVDLLSFKRFQAKQALTALHTKAVVADRIEENESLLSVAEHEIELPNHCYMHDKHVSQCYACRKRKWYGEISKDWKRIIEERIAELKAQLSAKEAHE